MVFGNVFIVLGSGVAGTILTGDAKLPKLGDVFSGAAKFVKKHGKEGGDAKSAGSSDQNTAHQLLCQINSIREEMQSLSTTSNTIVTRAANSGPSAYTITAVVVAGAIGYAYIKWKGWKLSDMMFVTKRGLSDACTSVGNHLDQVSDSVVVTRKHLAGRIDRVDITLDETQQIIEGTRDEVGIIHGDLSAFHEDLQSVNLVVRTLESKMGRLESSQDQTVDGINHLCEFTRKMEPSQNANVRQVSWSSIPAIMDSSSEQIVGRASCLPHLALESPISPAAESPRAETSLQVSPAAEQPDQAETTWLCAWAFRSPAWPTGVSLVLLHYTKEEDARITRPPSLLLQQLEEDSSHNDDGGTSSVDETNCSPLDKQEEEEVEVVRAAAILMSMTK